MREHLKVQASNTEQLQLILHSFYVSRVVMNAIPFMSLHLNAFRLENLTRKWLVFNRNPEIGEASCFCVSFSFSFSP